MKKLFITISIIIFSLLLAIPVYSRNINLPWSDDLDTDDYSDIRQVCETDGATFEHRTSGCWSGGCARFTPPTSYNTVACRRAGIANLVFNAGAQNIIYVRFLMRMSSDFEEDVGNRGYGTQDKFIIFQPDDPRRGMSILEQCTNAACIAASADYYTPGCCEDNECTYEGVTPPADRPSGDDGFKSEDYSEEWVCFEIMYNVSARISRIYVTTQDGALSGLYMERTDIDIATPTTIEGIGWYFNGYYSGSAWFELDEIAVDDEYIGPPAGFGGPYVTLTGTLADGATEAQIVTGGETLIGTVNGDDLVATFGSDNQITTDFIDGLTSGGTEAGGWNAQVKTTITHANITRDSNTQFTLTTPAVAGYSITTDETVTATMPASSFVVSTDPIVASPTYEITAANTVITLTGTLADGATEGQIVSGGETLIGTVSGDTLVATFGDDNQITTDFIAGLDSDGEEAAGWDAVVKAGLTHANITRDSDTQFTVLLPAFAGFDISANEGITCTVPASSLTTSSVPVVGSPLFNIIFFDTAVEKITGMTLCRN